MSDLLMANAWEQNPPSMGESSSALHAPETPDLAQRGTRAVSADVGGQNDCTPHEKLYLSAADATAAPTQGSGAHTDADVATTKVSGQLVTRGAKGGALVRAQPATFPGLYKDVSYPVYNIFGPPQPPGEIPPRVRRPPRPGPVFANDLSTVGERQHRAQREVSRMWRGVLCRRRLRQVRAMEEMFFDRARRIQCFWRCAKARWCRQQLQSIRDQWAAERASAYIEERILNIKNVIFWQHHRYDTAAATIQRLVRWHQRQTQRQACEIQGVPESEWPPALPQPITDTHRPYFPWRRAGGGGAGKAEGELDKIELTSDEGMLGQHGRTLLQFREKRSPARPLPQDKVEEINVEMRERNARRALALADPEVLSRAEWKSENLRREDLDFNAGVVQRAFRSKRAPVVARTKQLTEDYFNHAARIIARTFRMYILVKRLHDRRVDKELATRARVSRHEAGKITAIKFDSVWQRDLMDASATCIQRCWHWYRYDRLDKLPAGFTADDEVPSPPPYGILAEHITRMKAQRMATMNLMQQHEENKKRNHKCVRFVPERIIAYPLRKRSVAASEMAQ